MEDDPLVGGVGFLEILTQTTTTNSATKDAAFYVNGLCTATNLARRNAIGAENIDMFGVVGFAKDYGVQVDVAAFMYIDRMMDESEIVAHISEPWLEWGADPGNVPPGQIASVSCASCGDGRFTLAWAPCSEADFSYYVVQTATQAGGPFTTIATTATNAYFTTNQPEQTVYVNVLAVDSGGLSSPDSPAFSEWLGKVSRPNTFVEQACAYHEDLIPRGWKDLPPPDIFDWLGGAN